MENDTYKKCKNTKQIALSINMVRGCWSDSCGRQGRATVNKTANMQIPERARNFLTD